MHAARSNKQIEQPAEIWKQSQMGASLAITLACLFQHIETGFNWACTPGRLYPGGVYQQINSTNLDVNCSKWFLTDERAYPVQHNLSTDADGHTVSRVDNLKVWTLYSLAWIPSPKGLSSNPK